LVTAVLLGIYYFWYLMTVANHVRLITVTKLSTKVVFAMNQIMHLNLIGAMAYGVFSRHFANGGIQLYFIAILNFYIYLLAYINTPIVFKKPKKEEEP